MRGKHPSYNQCMTELETGIQDRKFKTDHVQCVVCEIQCWDKQFEIQQLHE